MRGLAGLLGLLFIAGAIITYWWWIVAVIALIGAVKLINIAEQAAAVAADKRRRQQAALIASADRQHAWVCAGDPRGTYGPGYRPLEQRDQPKGPMT